MKKATLDDWRAFARRLLDNTDATERAEAYLQRCDHINDMLAQEPLESFSHDELEELGDRIKHEVAKRGKRPKGTPKMAKVMRTFREDFAHALHVKLTGDEYNSSSAFVDEFVGSVFHVSARTARGYRGDYARRSLAIKSKK